jgi:hypothetical protein
LRVLKVAGASSLLIRWVVPKQVDAEPIAATPPEIWPLSLNFLKRDQTKKRGIKENNPPPHGIMTTSFTFGPLMLALTSQPMANRLTGFRESTKQRRVDTRI